MSHTTAAKVSKPERQAAIYEYAILPDSLVGSVALTATFLCAVQVSYRSKALIVGLLIVSFLWRYGLFLQVALSVFLLLYFAYLKARWK